MIHIHVDKHVPPQISDFTPKTIHMYMLLHVDILTFVMFLTFISSSSLLIRDVGSLRSLQRSDWIFTTSVSAGKVKVAMKFVRSHMVSFQLSFVINSKNFWIQKQYVLFFIKVNMLKKMHQKFKCTMYIINVIWKEKTWFRYKSTFSGSMEAVTKIAAEVCLTSSFSNLARVVLSGKNADTGTSWPKPERKKGILMPKKFSTTILFLKKKRNLAQKSYFWFAPLLDWTVWW